MRNKETLLLILLFESLRDDYLDGSMESMKSEQNKITSRTLDAWCYDMTAGAAMA